MSVITELTYKSIWSFYYDILQYLNTQFVKSNTTNLVLEIWSSEIFYLTVEQSQCVVHVARSFTRQSNGLLAVFYYSVEHVDHKNDHQRCIDALYNIYYYTASPMIYNTWQSDKVQILANTSHRHSDNNNNNNHNNMI